MNRLLGYGVQRCDSPNGGEGAQIPDRHSRESGNPVVGGAIMRVAPITWTFLYWVPACVGTTLRRASGSFANGQALSEYHLEMLSLFILFESRRLLGKHKRVLSRQELPLGQLDLKDPNVRVAACLTRKIGVRLCLGGLGGVYWLPRTPFVEN
jgi:hypothetical protein